MVGFHNPSIPSAEKKHARVCKILWVWGCRIQSADLSKHVDWLSSPVGRFYLICYFKVELEYVAQLNSCDHKNVWSFWLAIQKRWMWVNPVIRCWNDTKWFSSSDSSSSLVRFVFSLPILRQWNNLNFGGEVKFQYSFL